ncbi:MAG: hypothetical protein EPO10_26510 [Reyranella sp.]|nr:MAG: hypothetical protein EPO10_26510 [Reyranella sp.]
MAVRDRLVHLLTEAAEIEHNLLCSYLYAAFSLKCGEGDGLSPGEWAAVQRWRKTVLGVAIEEMSHLALVNNLLVALGGAPHFDRPNLPVPAGYHPAGFVIRLAPLTKATLDHFIYLERPEDAAVPEGAGTYQRRPSLERAKTPGALSPSTPDYETIGEFYAAIRASLIAFGDAATRDGTFNLEGQLSPAIANLPGLLIVRTLQDALQAVDTIIEQGEGSSCGKQNCHFSRFQAMRHEWSALEAHNPAFVPHLPAAHDPVMRKPQDGLERTWIIEPRAARLLDLGNALYALTLTCLQHAYSPALKPDRRKILVEGAIGLMHAAATIGTRLASMPAQPGGGINAGLTFAVPRNLNALGAAMLAPVLVERLRELRLAAQALDMDAVAANLREVEGRLPLPSPDEAPIEGRPEEPVAVAGGR